MATDNFGLKIGIEGEKEFKSQLAEINQAFKVLGSEMKLVESQFDKNDKSVEAMTARNAVLEKSIETQKSKIEVLRSALQNAADSFGENDKRTQEWQRQLNLAQAELNGMEKELKKNNQELENSDKDFDKAEKSADEFGNELDDASQKAEKSGNALEGLGSVAKGLAAVFAATMAAIGAAVITATTQINECVNVYADFDDSMKGVAATMGITAKEIAEGSKEYEMLEKAAKDAGSTTRYSASEASQALNYLALAGYDAEKAVETLPKVLNLAAAGGMDLATTSDLVTDAMSALNMKTDELDTFINQLAKTSQKSNTSVQQLGEAILKCAGTATTTGQDLTTVNTALGVLADNGIKGAEGGTHLRNVLLSLSAPTDTAKKALDDLGIAVFDSQGNMRDLTDILGDLNDGISDLSGEEKTNLISTIFNKTDLSAVNALLGATTGRFEELSGEIANCGEAATEMAETMESGLAGTTRSFNSAVEGMQIEIGSIFASMKQDMMTDFTDIIRNFTGILQEANGDWKKIGEGVGGLLTDVVNLFGERLPQVVDIMMTVLGMVGNAIIDNLPTIVSAASQIVLSILQGLISALPDITEGAVTLLTTLVSGIIDNLPLLAKGVIEMVATIVTSFADSIPTLLPEVVEALTMVVQTLVDNLPLLLRAVLYLVRGAATGIINAIPVLLDALPKVITSIVEFLVSAMPQIMNVGIRLITALVGGMPEIINKIISIVPTLITAFLTNLMNTVPVIIKAGIQLITSLVAALPTIIEMIVEVIPDVIDGIVNAVIDSIPMLVDAGIDLLVSLIQDLPQIIETIVTAIPQIITAIVSALVGNIDKIILAGVQLFVSLIENLPTIIVELVKAVPQIIKALVNGFSEGIGSFTKIGENLVKGLWEGIQGLASWLWDKVSNWASNLWNGILDFFGIHSPSRKMEWVGDMLMEGLAGGIDDSAGEVIDSANAMRDDLNAVFDELNSDMGGTSADFNLHNNLEGLDGTPGNRQSGGFVLQLQIENFNNNSKEDITELTNEIMETAGNFIKRKGAVFA